MAVIKKTNKIITLTVNVNIINYTYAHIHMQIQIFFNLGTSCFHTNAQLVKKMYNIALKFKKQMGNKTILI